MLLINFELNNPILTGPENCVISEGDTATTFVITDTKLYFSVATLSNHDNTKLLQQMKSGFRRTINWNKYQSKISTKRPNECLDYLMHTEQDIQSIFFQKQKSETITL